MVAPEHEDDRLVHLREVVRQPAQHSVGVPDAGGKVFQRAHGAGLEARRGFGDLHPLVIRVVILIIIGMVLHGDGVEEDGASDWAFMVSYWPMIWSAMESSVTRPVVQ